MFWMGAYTLRGEVGGGWKWKKKWKMELAYRLVPILQGPKNSGIPGPNPLPLPQVMYMHPSKTLCTGLYKSQVHRLFYAHEPPGDFNAV